MIHFGSIALGSLIMVIFKMIKDAVGEKNPCQKIVFKIIMCILGFGEEIIEGLSNIGYAFMAVSG